MKNIKTSLVLSFVLLVFITGCMEETKARNLAQKNKYNALKSFHSKPLKSLTCDDIDHQYERCSEYNWYNEIEFCQAKYTPVLMRCYGVKVALPR